MANQRELLPDYLPQPVRDFLPAGTSFTPSAPGESLIEKRAVLERNVIQRVLQKSGNSRVRTASILGVSRVTLYKKMKKYGLLEGQVLPQPLS